MCKFIWEYNDELDTWVCGTQNHGCGVYEVGPNSWEGNVVFDHNVQGISSFPTREEAQGECERIFNVLLEQN